MQPLPLRLLAEASKKRLHRQTDAWSFRDSCQTPTSYAIEAVDSEGVAAVLAEINHCGFTTSTGTEWKCAVGGCTPGAVTGTVGCSEVGSRTYEVIMEQMPWDQARAACRQRYPNGDLASIHSQLQQDQATEACRQAPLWINDEHDGAVSEEVAHGCWIGLNDQSQERRLVWSDGSPVDFAMWAPGEPNACQNNFNCAQGEVSCHDIAGIWVAFFSICQILLLTGCCRNGLSGR